VLKHIKQYALELNYLFNVMIWNFFSLYYA